VKGNNNGDGNFVVAGMQEMLNAIRGTGSTNVVIATGEDWGADLSGWAQYKPTDSAGQLVAGWHTYHERPQLQRQVLLDTQLAPSSHNPILTTESASSPAAATPPLLSPTSMAR